MYLNIHLYYQIVYKFYKSYFHTLVTRLTQGLDRDGQGCLTCHMIKFVQFVCLRQANFITIMIAYPLMPTCNVGLAKYSYSSMSHSP